jgi:hypothetical protein
VVSPFYPFATAACDKGAMDKQRLASILLSMVTAGLVLSEMAKVYVQFGVSTKPDPASGRTEAVRLAPEISHSWATRRQVKSGCSPA